MSRERSLIAVISRSGADRLAANDGLSRLKDVEIVGHENLAALVGPVFQSRIFQSQSSARTQYLKNYLSVLECAMEESPTLPAAPFSPIPDTSFAVQLLKANTDSIGQRLAQYGNRLEVQISVRWDINLVVRQILTQSDLGAPQDQPEKIKVRAARDLDEAIAMRKSKLTHAIHSAIRPLILDQVTEDKASCDILCAMKVMIAKDEETELYRVLQSISGGSAGQLKINCVGPLPPYSFIALSLIGDKLHYSRNNPAWRSSLEDCDGLGSSGLGWEDGEGRETRPFLAPAA
jgi:hypothetical protein